MVESSAREEVSTSNVRKMGRSFLAEESFADLTFDDDVVIEST